MAANVLAARIARAEVLKAVEQSLQGKIDDLTTSYDVIGKEETQAKDWRTGELKWDDDEQTIPHYDNKYGRVPIPEERLTEDVKAQLEAIEWIRTKLADLI